MGFASLRVLCSEVVGTGVTLIAIVGVAAAQPPAILASPTGVSVPFVGCRSDGQVGPLDGPLETSMSVAVSPNDTRDLAFYRSAHGIGVLAPRGWHCFGTYGSGGDTLYVTPNPIDTSNIFSSGRRKFAGSAIHVSRRFGDTSGRFSVAEIIARVFPAYKQFVTDVMQGFDQPPGSYEFGPYPADKLIYKTETTVEYQTPPRSEGLGTHSWLAMNETAIDGVAMLAGSTSTPDLLLLAVRLPSNQHRLTPAIVAQFERDAARRPVR